jgi:hypothetical protein
MDAPVVFWTHEDRKRGCCLVGLGNGARASMEHLLRTIPGGGGHLPNVPRHIGRITTVGTAATVSLRDGHFVGIVRPREAVGPVHGDGAILLTVRQGRDFAEAAIFPDEETAAEYVRVLSPRAQRRQWVAFEGERFGLRLDDPRRLDVDGRGVFGSRLERELDATLGRHRLFGGPQGDDAFSAYLRDPYRITARRLDDEAAEDVPVATDRAQH